MKRTFTAVLAAVALVICLAFSVSAKAEAVTHKSDVEGVLYAFR